MTLPQVAIITRTKDRPIFLRRAMHSVLSQTHRDWVHVIVNDGGDRKVVDLLVAAHEEAYEGRVKVVHHEKSRGMQNASNAGLDAVDSTYAVIHDDDDSWYPDFLAQTVAFLESEGPDSLIQGVATQTTQIMEEVTLTGQIEELKRRPYYPFAFVNLGELRTRNIFPPIAFLYRRQVHDKIGLFRQEFDVLGDHDFNLRFVRHFEIGVIPTFHAYYHWRHGSHGNTVTRHREVHRVMLNRMKNAYYRDALENPAEAVGDLEGIEFPPPEAPEQVPFRLRTGEAPAPRAMPDFRQDFEFDVLSLDVFDTVLRRRCHHPKDVFLFLQSRAVSELGLPPMPYAIARQEAEFRARKLIHEEVVLEEIYGVLAGLCGLDPGQAGSLMALELAIEKELLYADSRWLELYKRYRREGMRIVFVSDMYLTRDKIAGYLEGCGFEKPEVYVSCEYKLSKHTGTLQDLVAEKLGVAAGRILHIGDNFHSDCVRTWQAGWQAFHWSPDFNYRPWYAQVDPFQHESGDLLSPRIMGEVRRLGQVHEKSGDDRMERLGMEAAGPLYLAFLSWVIGEAKADGLRKLILLGRDGYYWEKALRLIVEKDNPGIEFCYLHSSRKVFNFSSFRELDEEAIKFLLTPNPALRVRDFLDRAGLDANQHQHLMEQVGFADPDQVLTNEMGGRFLESNSVQKLRDLFQLIKPQLEQMFARDRKGMLNALDQAEYKVQDCALVDIGWNGSCVRTVARLLNVEAPDKVRGYFFGTWREARMETGFPGVVKSFFMHLGKPAEHAALLRESINWIESLHAAPFPTLQAFGNESDGFAPQFSSELRSGFSLEQQEKLWKGASAFLEAILSGGLPAGGEYPGFTYINLVLHRLLREPSPAEVAEWGPILHSEGFGIEVYKRLVEPVDEKMKGQEVMSAYLISNWKRGFLASLSQAQRQFVLERIEDKAPKSFEQLKADLEYKIRQADELWGEKEEYKWRANHLQETVARLQKELDKVQGHLEWKIKQTEEFWAEKERNKGEAQLLREELEARKADMNAMSGTISTLQASLQESRSRIEEMDTQARQASERETGLNETIQSLNGRIASLEARKNDLEALFSRRGKLAKAFFTGRVPGDK